MTNEIKTNKSGFVCFWSLEVGDEVHPYMASDRACAHNLVNFLPPQTPSDTAIKQQVRKVDREARKKGVVIHTFSIDKHHVKLGALVKEEVAQSIAQATQRATLYLDLSTGYYDLQGDHLGAMEVLRAIAQDYHRNLLFTTDDLRKVVTSWMKKYAVPLRDHGGVYFVPQGLKDDLDNLGSFIHEISQTSKLYVLPQDKDGEDTLALIAANSLSHEYQELQNELQALLDPSRDTKTRDGTLKKRLSEFDAIKDRVTLFGEVLKGKAFDLQTQLDAAKQRLEIMLLPENCKKRDQDREAVLKQQAEAKPKHEVSIPNIDDLLAHAASDSSFDDDTSFDDESDYIPVYADIELEDPRLDFPALVKYEYDDEAGF